MSDIELVKEAVSEWFQGKLTSEQAMYAIHTVVNSHPPSKECIEWAVNRITQREDLKCLTN